VALPRWRVVGGEGKGGILVRSGRELSSSQLDDRLPTGAIVEELERHGDRLHFHNAEGPGPKEGWVSTRISGKDLLAPLGATDGLSDRSKPPPTSAAAAAAAASVAAKKSSKTSKEKLDGGRSSAAKAVQAIQAKPAEAEATAPQSQSQTKISPGSRPPGVAKHAVQQVSSYLGTFEVVRAACPVHEEPHMEAPVLGLKTRGTMLLGCEVTVNGWLKLAGERGWVLSTVYGCTPGLEQALHPVKGAFDSLAESSYHPQGMLRAEVVSDNLPVHAAPSCDSPILSYRRSGDMLFAQSQTLDGWLRLDHQEGWVPGLQHHLRPERSGLRILDAFEDEDMDLWALSAAWFAARRRKSAQSTEMTSADFQQLHNLARMTREGTRSRYTEHIVSGGPELLLSSGLVTEAQLSQPPAWIKQCIFGELLRRSVQQLQPFRDSIGRLPNYVRIPPLPLAEEEQTGSMGFWSSACLPFEFEAGPLMMAPNGLLLDPRSCEPIGRFLPQTREAESLTLMRHDEDAFFLNAKKEILDPLSLDVIGLWDEEKSVIRPMSTNREGFDDDVEPLIHLISGSVEDQQECTRGHARFEDLDDEAELSPGFNKSSRVDGVTDVDALD